MALIHDVPADPNVTAVQQKLADRAAVGLLKYGVTTERTDLTRLDWLRHAQEEAMDFCIYLQVLIHEETIEKSQRDARKED